MDSTIQVVIVVLAGGMFGVILGKLLDVTPDWVFWAIVTAFFILLVYLANTA